MKNLIILLFLLFSIPAFADFKGKVIKVSDGDTFTILTKDNKQIKVRLYGIDCPENKQDYGNKARQFAGELCHGKTVKVVEKGKDRYNRVLGIVYAGKVNVN